MITQINNLSQGVYVCRITDFNIKNVDLNCSFCKLFSFQYSLNNILKNIRWNQWISVCKIFNISNEVNKIIKKIYFEDGFVYEQFKGKVHISDLAFQSLRVTYVKILWTHTGMQQNVKSFYFSFLLQVLT